MKELSIPGLLCLAVTGLSAAAADISGRTELKLEGAVAQFRNGQMGKPVNLDVYAECDRGQWRDVWAESDEFNRAIHLGQITEATTTPEGLRLKARLMLGSDNWIKGGLANFDLVLTRESNAEAVTGTFTGLFQSPGGPFASQGNVTGRWLPPAAIATGFEPVKPGEHPRLRMRTSQIPALREKAQTPFGKGLIELLEKSSDPVALGLLYQLTGDRAYAERAKPETVKVMNNRDGGPFALGRFWGYRTSVVGAAYDLCHDAWEPEFREQVENYLDWILYKCLHRQHRVGTVNWDPGSNYTIVVHAGNGLAALALWGEPGAAPPEPLPQRPEAPRIGAPVDFSPAAGVPVVKLDIGKFPTEWLWIGPFALCPREWQPALLWHWLKLMGVSHEEVVAGTGVRTAFSTDEFNEGLELPQAFINYPIEIKPSAPDHVLPHVWEATTRGFYAFRNHWSDGPDSIVAQIYARDRQNCGWSQNEAGCFQIYGLGHEWARKLNDAVGKGGSRWHDNVVMLPEDPVNPSGRGKVIFFEADPKTGSGTVTFDMKGAYQCFREVGEGKDKKRILYDAGITCTRAFAADYSGNSGAPALFAIADHIAGGGKKIWAMQLPPVDRDGPDYKLDIQGNSLVIAYKDASLKATFVSPKNVQITQARGRMKAHPLSRIDDAEVNAIHASGADPAAGDFLVVLTLQKDAPPTVSAQDGATKIGGRTVTFDGRKLTLD